MGQLTRDELAALKPRTMKVDTPEWGEGTYVHVRELGADTLLDMSDAEYDGTQEQGIALCLQSICDESGQRLFGDDDGPLLMSKPYPPTRRCLDAILEINNMKGSAEKNSSETRSDDSPSD